MDLLTKQHFELFMKQVMERLDKQNELLLSLKSADKDTTLSEEIRLFDNQDLCMLLQISKRTLQRYRSIGALSYKRLGKKTYYSEADVLDFLAAHIKDFQKEDIAFYKARIHNLFNK
ncbi:MAG: helix-turn-helix domain-containing protein [Bacteroidales bacterium]|nr:helix-turn-helix domain-containing protein [Bacteroidales bacterium]